MMLDTRAGFLARFLITVVVPEFNIAYRPLLLIIILLCAKLWVPGHSLESQQASRLRRSFHDPLRRVARPFLRETTTTEGAPSLRFFAGVGITVLCLLGLKS